MAQATPSNAEVGTDGLGCHASRRKNGEEDCEEGGHEEEGCEEAVST